MLIPHFSPQDKLDQQLKSQSTQRRKPMDNPTTHNPTQAQQQAQQELNQMENTAPAQPSDPLNHLTNMALHDQAEALAAKVVEHDAMEIKPDAPAHVATIEEKVAEIIGGSVVPVKVRLINNISLVDTAEEAEDFSESLESVQLNNGEAVCLHNLLRKGKDGKPAGFLRQPLIDLVSFLGKIAGKDITVLGDVQSKVNTIESIADYIRDKADALTGQDTSSGVIAGQMAVLKTEVVEQPEQTDDEDMDLDDIAGQEVTNTHELDISSIASISVYPSINSEDGSLDISVMVNMRMMSLAKHEDKARFLRQINKVVTGILHHQANDSFEVINTVALNGELFEDASVRQMMDELLADNDDESPEYTLVSVDSMRRALNSGIHFSILPYGVTVTEAINTVMPYGGDLLLMQNK